MQDFKKLFFPLLIFTLFIASCSSERPLAKVPESCSARNGPVVVTIRTNPFVLNIFDEEIGHPLISEGTLQVRLSNGAFNTIDKIDSCTIVAQGLRARFSLPDGESSGEIAITFESPRSLQIAYKTPYKIVSSLRQTFADQGERYFGIWEHALRNPFDNRGVRAPFGPMMVKDAHVANARAPFFFTSAGYGVYLRSTAYGEFSFASEQGTFFEFQDSELIFDVYRGDYRQILQEYNRAAGPSAMPPLWALGSLWWRDDLIKSRGSAANAQAALIEDLNKLEENHIRASTILIDRPYSSNEFGWGNLDFSDQFPDPAALFHELSRRGYKSIIWIANRAAGELLREARRSEFLFLPRPAVNWPAIDLRRPQGAAWLSAKLRKLRSFGVQGYKIDRGDEREIPDNTVNYHAAIFPEVAAQSLDDLNGDYLIIARNINDTARRFSAVWSGDPRSTFEGLRHSLIHGLRSGLINFPMWGSDTAGYAGLPSKELFARWLALSAFSPLMDVLITHNKTILWNDFDNELIDIVRHFSDLHHSFIPYVRSYLAQATKSGMPVMRPLFLSFADDQQASQIWDEYLYGDYLLVAPVTEEGVPGRKVYLPPGSWFDYATGKRFEGSKSYDLSVPISTVPLFVSAGGIIVTGDILKGNNSWITPWKPQLRVEIFPDSSGTKIFPYFDGTNVKEIKVEYSDHQIIADIPDLGSDTQVVLRGLKARNVIVNNTPVSITRHAKQDTLFTVYKDAHIRVQY